MIRWQDVRAYLLDREAHGSNHITAQLNPTEESEFLLLQPLSPLARPNLSAWLAARSDGKNYGQLVLLRFPSETTIYGPEQIQALINQDPQISQQFSLWDRAGSEVIQGNLLVLPVGRSLIYVEPVYPKSQNNKNIYRERDVIIHIYIYIYIYRA